MKIGPLAVLREKQFAIVWSSLLVSDLGTWMQIAALGIYVAQTTGQAGWVGLITTATYLSVGILAPFGGAFADRYDRRRLVTYATLFAAVISAVLVTAIFTGHDSPLFLWFLAALQGAVSAAMYPALNAMVPDIVPKSMVSQATSLYHVSWNLGRSLGPLFAVAAISLGSFEVVFLINGFTFLVIAAAMTRLDAQPRHSSTGSAIQHLRQGIATSWSNRECRSPIQINMTYAVCVAPFIALIPVMSQLTLKGQADDTGHLYSAQGVGSILGVLAVASLIPRLGQNRTVILSLFGASICLLAYANSPTMLTALIWIIPLSGFHSSVLAGLSGLIALRAPANLRGRILGMANAAYNLSYAAAGVVLAVASDHFGLPLVLTITATTMLVGLIVTRLIGLHRQQLRQSVDSI